MLKKRVEYRYRKKKTIDNVYIRKPTVKEMTTWKFLRTIRMGKSKIRDCLAIQLKHLILVQPNLHQPDPPKLVGTKVIVVFSKLV